MLSKADPLKDAGVTAVCNCGSRLPRELWGTAGEVLVLVLTPLGHSLAEPLMGLRPRRVDCSRGRALSPAGTRRCPKLCAWQPPCASRPEGRHWLVFSAIWRGGVGARGTWAVAVPFSCGCCCATQESFPPCSAPGSNGKRALVPSARPLAVHPHGARESRERGHPAPIRAGTHRCPQQGPAQGPSSFQGWVVEFCSGTCEKPLGAPWLHPGLGAAPLPPTPELLLRAAGTQLLGGAVRPCPCSREPGKPGGLCEFGGTCLFKKCRKS